MADVKFRRIRGRVIPILQKDRAVTTAAVGAVGAVAGTLAIKHNPDAPKKGQSRGWKYGAFGMQFLSGAVSALPLKGARGLALGLGASFGLDAAAAGAAWKSVEGVRGGKEKQLKEFGKTQATGVAIGYTTFGAGLLANPAVRAKLMKWGAKILTRGK